MVCRVNCRQDAAVPVHLAWPRALLFLAGKVLFGMSWGRYPVWLPAVILCTSLSATCLGLLIATIVRTISQVSTVATLVILVMAGISGCFMPRAWLPQAMQQISLVTPHAWALIAYNQLLNTHNPDLPRVVRCCLMLIGFSGSYLMLGCGGSIAARMNLLKYRWKSSSINTGRSSPPYTKTRLHVCRHRDSSQRGEVRSARRAVRGILNGMEVLPD